MKVYEAVAAAVANEGVKVAYVLLGHTNMAHCIAMPKNGIRLISTRHEAGAVAMAEGHALASGEIGFASVTTGPGLTQLGTSLMMASRNGVPLVLLAGDALIADPGSVQAMDQRRFAEACECGYVQVRSVDSVLDDVRAAFYRAAAERRPIVLSIGTEFQYAEYPWDFDYVPSTMVRSGRQAVAPDQAALDALVMDVMGARKPVIVAGRGAVEAGAHDAILELAQRIGALTLTTLPAKGWLSDDPYQVGISGLFLSVVGEELTGDADLVIAVGASLNKYTMEAGLQFPRARVVSVNTEDFARPVHTIVDSYVKGDGRRVVEELCKALEERDYHNVGYRDDVVLKQIEAGRLPKEKVFDEGGPGLLDPRDVVMAVDRSLRSDSYVVVGSGHQWAFPISYMSGPGGNRFLTAGYFGAVGQFLPLGIGVSVAKPDESIVVFEGDGGLMMNIQELDTAARYGIRMLLVVMNDEAFGAEVHILRGRGLDDTEVVIPSPRFDAVAASFGWRGSCVSDMASLERALEEFWSGTGPYVIDVRISRDVASNTAKRLERGEANETPLV